MSLTKKCLLFACAILMFQFLIFSGLIFSLVNSQKQTEEISHSHRAVSAGSTIENLFNGAIEELVLFVVTRNKEAGDRYQQKVQRLKEEIAQLKSMSFSSPEDKQDIDRMSESTSYILYELTKASKNTEETGSAATIRRLLNIIRLEIEPHLKDFMQSVNDFSDRHKEVEEKTRNRVNIISQVEMVVGSVFVANVLTTILIIIGFSRGVVRRLSIISDNFSRYGSKRRLHAAQPGADEISLLDRQFHDLCDALSDATEKEKAVFANMPVGLVTCGEQQIIEDVNPKIEELIGTVQPGTVLESLLVEKGADAEQLKLLTIGKNSGPCRLRFQAREGAGFPGEVTVSRFLHRGEQKVLLAILDVSEREEVENLRQQFVGIVSHDIRSPLTSIDACLTLFSQGVLGELNSQGEKHLSIARQETERLMKLTSDLLDLARIEGGNIRLSKTNCSVLELMEEAIESVKLYAGKRKLRLEVEPTELKVSADPDRIIQLLINFLSNACKYSPDGKSIRLYAEEREGWLRINVQDEGVGIPKAFRETIFERFKQVRDDDAKRGTGLGLSICRLLAEAHAGSVGVNSEVNQGSIFWVDLPYSQSQAPSALEGHES